MKIPKILLTKNEMYEAVGQWLAKKGLALTVKKVDFDGYPAKGFEVECEEHQLPAIDEISPPPITDEELDAQGLSTEDIHEDYVPTKDPKE